jgi:Uma2 family endonuclease
MRHLPAAMVRGVPLYDVERGADESIDDGAPGAVSGGWLRDTIAPHEVGRHTVAISLRLAAVPSDEEVLELSRRNPGFEFERTASGELVVTPTGARSGRRELRLCTQIDAWAESDGSGLAFGPSTGFHLPDGSLLSPDASWVRRDRWDALSAEQQEGFAPFCPDAVFEIASKSDVLPALRRKMRAYLANGGRLAVLIDPQRRAVEVYAPDQDPKVLEPAASIALDPVMPGFVLELGPILE